jgi:hypothetical protein
MQIDGYLRTSAEEPFSALKICHECEESLQLFKIGYHYGLCREKMLRLYNAGFLELNGLDCEKAVTRYLQQHSGKLSVRLLSYVAYSEVWPASLQIQNQAAYDLLSALKIDGKLSPPKYLGPYLDGACRGLDDPLERVARWVRDMLDSTGKAHGWEFFGVRLALTEGHYELWPRSIPKLRRLRKMRGLPKLLREHPLLHGYVTQMTKSRQNRSFTYVYHRPGVFWDL